MKQSFTVGIDLGTSNSAVAVCSSPKSPVDCSVVTQIVGRGQIGTKRGLASALFFPHEGQFTPDMLKLPWMAAPAGYIIGTFAREAGAQDPDRLVHSAKSWLCNPNSDATSATLPWNSEIYPKISPLEASRLYLEHLLASLRNENSGIDLSECQFVVTVPASFDESARHLTALATKQAGLGDSVILLEEPLAAFYAWLDTVGPDWRKQIHPGDVVLICDVGGGTTDFSLLAVREEAGELQLDRISVGEHILLGGDNMDLALAYVLREQMETEGKSIDDWQFLALIHAARIAKESLYENPERPEAPIAVPSRGSSLFAGTLATKLTRETLDAIISDGFFARTAANEFPVEQTSAGLQEFGLPYASDAVISKHLCQFLQHSLRNTKANPQLASLFASQPERFNGELLIPNAILFNGGVFRAQPLRQRVVEIIDSWAGGHVRELRGADYDLAVAKGAARYGMNKRSGQGIRIRAGASRSYYIGLESSLPAIPGYKPPIKALCVVPQGMEEGSEATLDQREFALMTGTTVQFRFYSANSRAGDKVGSVVSDAEKHLDPASRLEMTLPVVEGMPEKTAVPVKLHARLSELGVLELWMQHTRSERRWRLDYSVRTE
ncbi:MAG: Hsp70 family protein [Verrucomicrobiota bacterium]|nr:Hsp70 family protein [Verrucomicrobiota bacterium]